ncbi:MAG TPA: sigma-E factor negative regulatory protein [Methylophilaceae bacterium]|nr:sigma-E factor negative regulatory protein [Methylophilaceae bacterium]
MKDQISALMDGEQALSSSEHVYTALKAGGELSECWSTYHLIGDVMRGTTVMQADFYERLMQKLEAEPTILAPRARKPFVKSPALWSAAASVSAVQFVGWMVLQQQSQTNAAVNPQEIAQNLPTEYLLAHQASAASSAAYYIQPAVYSGNGN